jgi:type II secretory pathway component PulF
MMKIQTRSYNSGSVSEVAGPLTCSTTTMWWLVGLLAAVSGLLVAPSGRRPDQRSATELGGALTYPIIMMCVGAGIMLFLVAYVVPQVATIFEQQHAALPLATKLLIRFSASVTAHWLAMTILSVGLVAGIVGALATPRGRRLYDYYNSRPSEINTVLEPVMTLAMAAIIVFMMLAVLMPIFQLN